MKKVAIVTVNFNTADDTTAFLKSIEHIDKQDLELDIIVVDNGSKDIYALPSFAKSHVTLIRSDENTGFSGGYNIGMKEALSRGAEYVMIVNNDTEADKRMVHELIDVLDRDEKIGMTVPKIYFAKGHEFHKERYKKDELGKVFWYAGGHIDWANVHSIHRGVDEVDNGQYDEVEPVEFATGCCMMFKTKVLEEVGLLDDEFFLYYEDADLNQRIKKAGYKVYYVPTAVLIHINAASSGGAGNGNVLQDYFITRNRMLFGMRYAPLRTKIALMKESIRLLKSGREYQQLGIKDFYQRKFHKGSFFEYRNKQK